MIKKQLKLIITFSTTTEAMAMEHMCKTKALDGRLIPVPKTITAGCGLAWCAKTESREHLDAEMKAHQIQAEGFYECMI